MLYPIDTRQMGKPQAMMEDVSTAGVPEAATMMFRIWKPHRFSRIVLSVSLVAVMTMTFANFFLNGNTNRRHPLNMSRRRLSGRQVRFLTLGGPSTWGLGLQDPEESGFARKLSASVHNAGQRVGGSTLASLCTQSIVGGNVYDVIVLEFSWFNDDFSSLSLLARRLRKRFPRARIIFVQLWTPSQIIYKKDERIVTFDEWRGNQTEIAWGSPEFLNALQDYSGYVPWRDEMSYNFLLTKLVQQVGGYLYRLPQHPNAKQSLKEAKNLFLEMRKAEHDQDDGAMFQYTLSPYGHELVANAILSYVDVETILESSRKTRNEVGSWGSGDSCQLWYETGNVDMNKLSYQGFGLRLFSKTSEDKYALELSEQGGSITIQNPFNHDRMVFLTYMTTSGFSFSNKVYPATKVQVLDKNSVIVDPLHEDDSIRHHISRTTAIGKIPPGRTTLRFDAVERTVSPFRIIGMSLLANEKLDAGIPTEFALSPEPAHVGELHTYLDLL
jgi:hypothetical protein